MINVTRREKYPFRVDVIVILYLFTFLYLTLSGDLEIMLRKHRLNSFEFGQFLCIIGWWYIAKPYIYHIFGDFYKHRHANLIPYISFTFGLLLINEHAENIFVQLFFILSSIVTSLITIHKYAENKNKIVDEDKIKVNDDNENDISPKLDK